MEISIDELKAHCEVALKSSDINEQQLKNIMKNVGLLGFEVRLRECHLALKYALQYINDTISDKQINGE